jgi:hypothetical protein
MVILDSSQLHIGMNRQFFFDNRIMESVQNVTRTCHRPAAESSPLITADRPWENISYFLISSYAVVKDRDEHWHCWYNNWEFDPVKLRDTNDWFGCSRMQLCYAASTDGINWEKPGLGKVTVDGMDTNIVIGGDSFGSIYNVTPIEDPFEEDPRKRFKTLGIQCGKGVYRVISAYSADGIDWKLYDSPPSFGTWGNNLSDVTVLSYDRSGRMYTALVRSPYQYAAPLTPENPSARTFIGPSEPDAWWRMNKRRVFMTESPDMIHWSQPYPVLQPDGWDNLDDSYFGMCQFRVGDTYIGFINIFHECSNTIDVRLAYSYDGRNWDQINDRQPWLTGKDLSGNEWDSVLVTQGVPPIEDGDTYRIYYGGANAHHDLCFTGLIEGVDHWEARGDMSGIRYGLGLAKLRLDGFVSIDAFPYREGVIVTRPLFMEGGRIVINAMTRPGGYIEMDVADMKGNVIEGYSRSECGTFSGDDVRHVMTWNGDPEACFNDYVKLRIYMKDASLYTIQSADPADIGSSSDPDVSRKLSVVNWR